MPSPPPFRGELRGGTFHLGEAVGVACQFHHLLGRLVVVQHGGGAALLHPQAVHVAVPQGHLGHRVVVGGGPEQVGKPPLPVPLPQLERDCRVAFCQSICGDARIAWSGLGWCDTHVYPHPHPISFLLRSPCLIVFPGAHAPPGSPAYRLILAAHFICHKVMIGNSASGNAFIVHKPRQGRGPMRGLTFVGGVGGGRVDPRRQSNPAVSLRLRVPQAGGMTHQRVGGPWVRRQPLVPCTNSATFCHILPISAIFCNV